VLAKDELLAQATVAAPTRFCAADIAIIVGHKLTSREVAGRLSIMERRGAVRVVGVRRYGSNKQKIYERA
jgi:hypothetical protein